MGATVTINDELYERALDLAGPTDDQADLCCEAIIATFARGHSGKRLAAMGTAGRETSEAPRHLDGSVYESTRPGHESAQQTGGPMRLPDSLVALSPRLRPEDFSLATVGIFKVNNRLAELV